MSRRPLGQVGTVGVPIDCVEDMEIIYKDIPIDQISASIVTHYPRNTPIIFPLYLVMAERRGIPWEKLPGSVQNDFIMESVVRSASEYIRPRTISGSSATILNSSEKMCRVGIS
jgi:methylmalonyl-CoA mutase N-terminal domain/subunit